jgi:hypothetical protein
MDNVLDSGVVMWYPDGVMSGKVLSKPRASVRQGHGTFGGASRYHAVGKQCLL